MKGVKGTVKRMIGIGICLALLFGAAGCGQENSDHKTKVTMMYPTTLERFEQLVEETYPDIDLQVEPTTSAVLNGDSERRLRNGRGNDLVVTTLPTGDVKIIMLD